MFSRAYWLDTAERVTATFAVTMLAVLNGGTVGIALNWGDQLKLAGMAAGGTLFKCLAARGKGDPDSASLLPVSVIADEDGMSAVDLAVFVLVILVLLALLGRL